MRHREFLISIGAKTLSLHGMAKTPWRRGKQIDLHPGGVIEAHTSSQGHSGERPLGKVQKNKRVKTGPPGTPNGICINASRPGTCACGRHYKESKA